MTAKDMRSIFDRAVSAYGGRLPIKSVPKHSRPLFVLSLQSFRSFLERIRVLPTPYVCSGSLYLDYIANDNFNALAFTRERHEFIGVFAGVPARIFDAFFTLLSSDMVLPEIGNSRVETMPMETLQLRMATLFSGGVNSKEQLPNDPIRRAIAGFLGVNVLSFLFAHELAHIIRGHLAYLEHKMGLQIYSEWGMSSDAGLRNEDMQAIEFGADSHAATAAWTIWSSLIDYAGKDTRILKQHPGLWVFSLGVMFRMFERFGSTALTHPLPGTRFVLTTYLSAGMTSSLVHELRDLVPESFMKMAKHSVDLWEHLGLGTETFMRYPRQIEFDIMRLQKDYAAIETSFLLSFQNNRSDKIRKQAGYRYSTSDLPSGEEWEKVLSDNIGTIWRAGY